MEIMKIDQFTLFIFFFFENYVIYILINIMNKFQLAK